MKKQKLWYHCRLVHRFRQYFYDQSLHNKECYFGTELDNKLLSIYNKIFDNLNEL